MPNPCRVHDAHRRVVRLCVLMLAGAWGATLAVADASQPTARPDTAARHHIVSVKDSPGYTPPVDPEARSELIGRRLNAPRVSKRFVGGARSLDDLGRTLCRALQYHQVDTLESLCIRYDEFRDILWREFPQSRPATGVLWQDAWFFTLTRNRKGCGLAMGEFGGRSLEFLSIEADSTLQYRNFKLYSKITMAVRAEDGDTLRWGWVKAVVGRKGRFKLLSLRD
jgi:hypothetical protein